MDQESVLIQGHFVKAHLRKKRQEPIIEQPYVNPHQHISDLCGFGNKKDPILKELHDQDVMDLVAPMPRFDEFHDEIVMSLAGLKGRKRKIKI